jgi:hypothetical protein
MCLFPDDVIPSPPDEAPSPVGSLPDDDMPSMSGTYFAVIVIAIYHSWENNVIACCTFVVLKVH